MTESSLPGDDTLTQRVTDAQTELLYRRSQLVNWAGLGFALLMAAGLTPHAPAAGVWAWVALRGGAQDSFAMSLPRMPSSSRSEAFAVNANSEMSSPNSSDSAVRTMCSF